MIPGLALALQAGGAGIVWGILVGGTAALLRRRGMRVAYTRKVFHFGVFSGAALVHAWSGLPGTNAYGAAVAAMVLAAVLRGDGDPLYEALARDTDRPRRTLFVVVPLATTAAGGFGAALLAGPFAAVGYLVAGWADAVAEPVGARWGRHPYRVPSLAGVPARRTWEGTLAILLVAWGATQIALQAVGVPAATAARVAPVVALCSAAVEAVSPHGTDNLTVQIAPSLLALWLAG